MEYIGLAAQQRRNNRLSALLMLAFPLLILLLVYIFLIFAGYDSYSGLEEVNIMFVGVAPFVVLVVGIWFLIAYKMHTRIIMNSAGARPLSRKENMRVYNLVENLCIASGMTIPKVFIIDDPALNAFASGVNQQSYAVTLTSGIIKELNDEELEGVIAHELMHIRNNDVRLLIISIVFVGILAFAAEILFRSMLRSTPRVRSKNDKGGGQMLLLVALLLAVLGYIFSMLFRFALSRKREYLADAGAADMTKNPKALANALRKVSRNYKVSSVKSAEVAELFLENRKETSAGFSPKTMLHNLFATHPPIDKRIAFLDQV
jgi:heat shock protein HtpX